MNEPLESLLKETLVRAALHRDEEYVDGYVDSFVFHLMCALDKRYELREKGAE